MSPRFERFFKKRTSSTIVLPTGEVENSDDAPLQSPTNGRRLAMTADSLFFMPDMGRYKEGDALFSFRKQTAPNDLITVLFSPEMKYTDFLIKIGQTLSIMPRQNAELDTNIANIDLELLDLFEQHPSIFSGFFVTLTDDERNLFIHLLTARGILQPLLGKLIDNDIQDHIDHHPDQLHTLFRDETPAIMLIATFIRLDKNIIAFRNQMMTCMEDAMQILQHIHLRDELAVSRFLEVMQGKCHDNLLPDGIIMIMHTMKMALSTRNQIQPIFKDKILGSIFLLRYLCAGFTTPATLPLCKKLMVIINQTEDENEPHTTVLLREQMVHLLNTITDMTYVIPPQPLENLKEVSEVMGKKILAYCDNLSQQDAKVFIEAWRNRYGHSDDELRRHREIIAQLVPPPPLPVSPLARASNSNNSPRSSIRATIK